MCKRCRFPKSDFLRTGWKLYAFGKSPFNAAFAYTLAHAINGAYPDYQINPSKVLVSRGHLAPPLNAQAIPIDGSIDFLRDDNSGNGSAKQTDKALVAIINQSKGQAITDVAGADRMTASQSLAMPSDWIDDEVNVYLGFISEDGSEISNSVYLGAITVA